MVQYLDEHRSKKVWQRITKTHLFKVCAMDMDALLTGAEFMSVKGAMRECTCFLLVYQTI